MHKLLFLVLVSFFMATPGVFALEVGEKVGEFSFKDIRFLPITMEDLSKPAGELSPKAYVFAFIANECPLAQRYLPKLIDLEKEFADQGVRVFGVNANPGDTIQDMALHALQYRAFFPMFKDMYGEAVEAFGATRTPEIFVLDAGQVLRYKGRVDDQYRLGGLKPQPSRDDLKEAINEILAGKEVSVPETQAEGCRITLMSVPEPEVPVTYNEHIVPILDRYCTDCHHDGGGAPIDFTRFKKVSGNAEMIGEVSLEGRMPPWYAHPEYGEYANDRAMTPEEKLVIQQWIKYGQQEGDAALAPAPREFEDREWVFEPDVVITADKQNALPATGFIPYQYVMLPYVFEEDTWIDRIQIKGSNMRVIHHANLFYKKAGELQVERMDQFLTGYVPGGLPAILPAGMGLLVPKGATLGLQIHLVTTGKPEANRMQVALKFPKQPIEKRVYYKLMDPHGWRIPPYDPAFEVVDETKFEADSTILAFFSHMHLRGKDMLFKARYPTGDEKLLCAIPNYNFDWQIAYYTAPDAFKIPKDTVIECTAHFDNSIYNPYNPAPEKTIQYGPQTVDEMFNGFIFYTKDEENLQVKVDPKTGYALEELASNQ